MTITPLDAANAINYLLAAQALTVMDNQETVWADYLNHEAPQARPADLLPACRAAIKAWSSGGRKWRIDVEEYARAIRTIRAQRIDAAGLLPYPPASLDGTQSTTWERALKTAIADGRDVETAELAAYAAIGQTKSPEPVYLTDPDRIRNIIERTAS